MADEIQQIQVADSGLAFIVVVSNATGPIDLSLATVKRIIFQKPDGSLLTVDAEFTSDGTNGSLMYVTTPTDFDQSGTWYYQVYIEIGPTHAYSNTNKFKVFPNLPLGS